MIAIIILFYNKYFWRSFPYDVKPVFTPLLSLCTIHIMLCSCTYVNFLIISSFEKIIWHVLRATSPDLRLGWKSIPPSLLLLHYFGHLNSLAVHYFIDETFLLKISNLEGIHIVGKLSGWQWVYAFLCSGRCPAPCMVVS